MNQEKDVDWNEPALAKWLGTNSKRGTIVTYKSDYRAYAQFTGMTAEQLVDEALDDAERARKTQPP